MNDRWFYLIAILLIVGGVSIYAVRTHRATTFTLPETVFQNLYGLDNVAYDHEQIGLSEGQNLVLLLKLDHCDSCVHFGLSELEKLRQEQKTMIWIVHQYPEEVAKWAVHVPETPVFRIAPADFGDGLQKLKHPVLMTFDQNRLITHQKITPEFLIQGADNEK